MGFYRNYLLFVFLNISTILGQNLCPSSNCGSSGNVTVHYPFKFEHEKLPTLINCTYFSLSCNETSSTTIVNLPLAGEFYVQKINYAQRYIQLYDPQNCLTKRLFDLSLEYSPFKADYDNYTLYVCPLDFDADPILCLSNSTNITIAARGSFKDDHKCEATRSGLLPVDHNDIFLFLTWDTDDDCMKCNDHDSDRWGSKIITKIVAVAMTLPGLIIMSLSCCSVFCFHLVRMMGGRYAPDSAAAAEAEEVSPSTTSNPGLDASKIVRCTELVIVSESNESNLSCNNSKTCSICLENYSEKETMSVISKCGHCFHADCIHQWLGKKGSCPVCRTSLSDVV